MVEIVPFFHVIFWRSAVFGAVEYYKSMQDVIATAVTFEQAISLIG